ncbi:MAG TPA: DUF4252 domain-containing protein [Bacteroidales bacterium]|nr:DUF4252 domain-containing protein [Bacteroidales bacterium]
MKRLLILFSFIASSLVLAGQNSEAIDELFQKYEGKDGITSVKISSKMLSMFSNSDEKGKNDDDLNNIFSKLKSIRILTVEDSTLNLKLNFYEELRKKADFSKYEELMVVNEADGTTKFLIMQSGKKISELLIISGGKKGNTLISISGDLDLKNISELSGKMGIQQLQELDKLDKKNQKE